MKITLLIENPNSLLNEQLKLDLMLDDKIMIDQLTQQFTDSAALLISSGIRKMNDENNSIKNYMGNIALTILRKQMSGKEFTEEEEEIRNIIGTQLVQETLEKWIRNGGPKSNDRSRMISTVVETSRRLNKDPHDERALLTWKSSVDRLEDELQKSQI
jgi:hypothetical protein